MNQRKKLQAVLLAIQETPEAANDDALLMAKIWEKEGWNPSLSLYENLKRVSRPETITRRRRQAHQLGLIEYSKPADKERKQAFESEKESHSGYDFAKVKGISVKDPEAVEVVGDWIIKSKSPQPYEQVNIFNLEEKN